ncbi:unnamed protein product [Menidia menidia]|uniref:(Atlantic silverside) hypothetical protein n=1 Tax=Menidia menidia TaxID=238744 RepID=A0A8S4BDL2_9TELE|nr:unnamed protein product [Menidia menidia]
MSGHTSQSATTMTSPSSRTSVTTTTPSTQSSVFTSETTKSVQTTVSSLSTSHVNENASYSVSTATESVDRATHGLDLNTSEKSMTIIFSAVLGVFALGIVTIMLHKCKHKVQYLHQPIHSSEEADEFVAGEDTLVISGGLYDGHPIYDRLPPDPPNQSQVCLEFFR